MDAAALEKWVICLPAVRALPPVVLVAVKGAGMLDPRMLEVLADDTDEELAGTFQMPSDKVLWRQASGQLQRQRCAQWSQK